MQTGIILICNAIFVFLLGLFLKNYLPSYMDKKGGNLATKEDIAEITRKTEEVQNEFREGFEQYSSDVKFKYDFYFKQYSELYTKLYAIICQSEYVRQFIKIRDDKLITFDEAPFLEVTPTHRMEQKTEFSEGKPTRYSQKETIIETEASQFNKKKLCDLIIELGELSSQKLLKLAVAYRFAYHYYTGNPNTKNSDSEEVANEEEFRLIRGIVCCIVSEYNFLRKELKMEHIEDELTTGILSLKENT